MENNIKSIMSEIELEIGKLDIFTKFSKETILLGGLAVCRERINRIIDSNSYGKELIDEIETIDIVTQLASEYAVGSEKIDLNKIKGKHVFMSSVTDCYNNEEEKYKITRSILEQLVNAECFLNISTKSHLILRDIDLLKNFNNLVVSIFLSHNFTSRKLPQSSE